MKIGLIAGILACFGLLAYAGDEESRLEGNWRGDSLCVADRTACRDEKVVYRIAKIPGKPDRLAITGDKIVTGVRLPWALSSSNMIGTSIRWFASIRRVAGD
jgi:hypothetical protein